MRLNPGCTSTKLATPFTLCHAYACSVAQSSKHKINVYIAMQASGAMPAQGAPLQILPILHRCAVLISHFYQHVR